MVFSSLTIVSPWFLLLLLIVPWFWWLGRRSLAGLGKIRAFLAVGLRTTCVIAIVLSLAEMQTRQTSRAVSVVYLLDQSLSIPVAKREKMFRYVAREVEAHRQAARGDRAGVIVFGREAVVEVPPIEDSLAWLTGSESVVDGLPEATNLADAVRLAVSILPHQGARRIVLLTDGNENIGDVRQLAPQVAEQGIGVDVVAVRLDESFNIAVEKVVVPAVAQQGSSIEVRVVIRHDGAAAFSSLAELQTYDCVVLANVARVAEQDGDTLFRDAQIDALVRNTELGCGLILPVAEGHLPVADEESLQEQETIEVTRSRLSLILDGIDLSSARQRMRFQPSREMFNRDEPTAR